MELNNSSNISPQTPLQTPPQFTSIHLSSSSESNTLTPPQSRAIRTLFANRVEEYRMDDKTLARNLRPYFFYPEKNFQQLKRIDLEEAYCQLVPQKIQKVAPWNHEDVWKMELPEFARFIEPLRKKVFELAPFIYLR